jgi:hypothetical protein
MRTLLHDQLDRNRKAAETMARVMERDMKKTRNAGLLEDVDVSRKAARLKFSDLDKKLSVNDRHSLSKLWMFMNDALESCEKRLRELDEPKAEEL